MKTAKKNMIWQGAIWCVALLATGAMAQMEMDARVTGIDVEVSGGDFRILLVGLTDMTDHDLTVDILFDGTLVQRIGGLVSHAAGTWSCYAQSSLECDQGDCADMVWLGVSVPAHCAYWNLGRCGCCWSTTLFGEWVAYTAQQLVTCIVDPLGVLPDLDPSNNEMTIELGPVAADELSWTAVKALYR
jgi:hypothetical protein